MTRDRRQGFTIVEMLVVIAIITVLSIRAAEAECDAKMERMELLEHEYDCFCRRLGCLRGELDSEVEKRVTAKLADVAAAFIDGREAVA